MTNRRLIPFNNHIRWNNWHIYLFITLLFIDAIDMFIKAHVRKLTKDFITLREWERLHKIKEFLKLFKRATLKT